MPIIALGLVLVLAGLLRTYKLTSVPPSLSLDEVSIGYNAYSILETGFDEYGIRSPLLLRAYDDWRPALYVYFVAALIPFFNLSTIAIRLPSIILSLLTVVTTYLLTRCIARQFVKTEYGAVLIALFAASILAVSPWHIYLSRLGHEANLGQAATALFVYFLIRYICSKRERWAWASMVGGVVALYGYQSQKIVIPLITLSFVFIWWHDIQSRRKKLIPVMIVGSMLIAPLVFVSVSPEAMLRFQATSAFDENTPRFADRALLYATALEERDVPRILRYHYRTTQIAVFLENYARHLDIHWLAFGGDHESHKVPGMGLLYLWEVVFIVVGALFLLRSRLHKRLAWFMFCIIAIGPIPAALTTQAPHAMRSYTVVPFIQILAAFGFYRILVALNTRWWKGVVVFGMSLCVLVGVRTFWRGYYDTFPRLQSQSFQYPYTRALSWLKNRQHVYDRIVISNRDNLYQSYMFYLYYWQFSPYMYQSLGGTISGGYNEVHTIGKFEFRPITWDKEERQMRTLFIGNTYDFPAGEMGTAVFKALDGTDVVKAVEVL